MPCLCACACKQPGRGCLPQRPLPTTPDGSKGGGGGGRYNNPELLAPYACRQAHCMASPPHCMVRAGHLPLLRQQYTHKFRAHNPRNPRRSPRAQQPWPCSKRLTLQEAQILFAQSGWGVQGGPSCGPHAHTHTHTHTPATVMNQSSVFGCCWEQHGRTHIKHVHARRATAAILCCMRARSTPAAPAPGGASRYTGSHRPTLLPAFFYLPCSPRACQASIAGLNSIHDAVITGRHAYAEKHHSQPPHTCMLLSPWDAARTRASLSP